MDKDVDKIIQVFGKLKLQMKGTTNGSDPTIL